MKPSYHSSNLIHYPFCKRKFYLSMHHRQERTPAMRDGLLFESYLFGFRSDEIRRELEGRRLNKDGKERKLTPPQEAKLDNIKRKANYIKDKYQFEGEPFKKYIVEFDEFTLEGESDFVGKAIIDGEEWEGIIDTKFTSSISKNWNSRNSKGEFFQSVMYPMLELAIRHNGEIDLFTNRDPMQFAYLIIENNNFEVPLHEVIQVEVTRNDLKWLWNQIVDIHNARNFEYPADSTEENCLGVGYYSQKCPFLEHCPEGRSLIELNYKVKFSQLNEV